MTPRLITGLVVLCLASSMACATQSDPFDNGGPGGGGGPGDGEDTGAGGNPGGGAGAPGTAGSPGSGGGTGGANAGTGGGPSGGGGSGGMAGSPGDGGPGGAGGAPAAVPLDPALRASCAGTNPIRCAIPVAANGNYTVTVELGDPAAASVSRVQAELYRIVAPAVTLAAGQYAQQTFSANVRAEQHDGYTAPGMVLDLLIDAPAGGPAPRLRGLGVVAAPSIPTIFLAGDSTVCDWDPALATILDPSERGWAQELSQYLLPGIAVANYADSGETADSFYRNTRFYPPERAAMRAGDYLLIQFGHNDQKTPEDIAAYPANLTRFITEARARNVTPVLLTPVARKGASTASPGFEGLDQAARDLAAAQNVTLVDLTALSLAYYRTVPNLSALFATPTEGTHFGEAGATQIAGLVAGALKAGSLPLRSFVK